MQAQRLPHSGERGERECAISRVYPTSSLVRRAPRLILVKMADLDDFFAKKDKKKGVKKAGLKYVRPCGHGGDRW